MSEQAFDVIIAGAGPAGLMAAIRCVNLGLKTLLLERKLKPSSITRTCAQAFFTPVPGYDTDPRFYQETVSLTTSSAELHRFDFKTLGFDLDYHGPLAPMHRFTYLSPSGHRLDRYPVESTPTWCLVFNKEDLISQLLDKARRAGVTVMAGIFVIGAVDTGQGVEVHITSNTGTAIYRAGKLVAADGVNSRVVENLGWNTGRRLMMPLFKGLSYIVDGITPDIGRASESGFFFIIPSVNNQGLASIGRYPESGIDGRCQVVFSGKDGWNSLRVVPRYADWFAKAKVVRRTAVSTRCYYPIIDPARGNVIAAGDSAALFETLVSGALACGYQAANAIMDELQGKAGNMAYNNWWKGAFDFNAPGYRLSIPALPLAQLCTDAETDALFQILRGKTGVPGELALTHLDDIRHADHSLYQKLQPTADRLRQ